MERCQEHSAHTEKLNNLEKQLGNMQGQTEAIIKMGMSIQNMAEKVEDLLTAMTDHNRRIETLEKAPAENIAANWKVLVIAVISAIGGGLGTLIVGFIIRGG